MKSPYWTDAELDLHNAITSAVEASTYDANLATGIADSVVTDALNPTPALLRHLAERFDSEAFAHVGATLYSSGTFGAGYLLRKIATDLEKHS